jgi:hypothetical protein
MTLQFACQPFVTVEDVFDDRCACALDEGEHLDLVEDVIDMASDILTIMSGGRIAGICDSTYRPVKVGGGACAPAAGGMSDHEYALFGQTDMIPIPGIQPQVIEVEIDGVVLNPSEYGLMNGRYLFRREGSWPASNDLLALDSADGVFSITIRSGLPPDFITRQAAIELTCEIVSDVVGAATRLPRGARSANLQGVAVALSEQAEADEEETDGLARIRRFYAWHCQDAATVWSPETNRGWELVTVSGPSGS